jgi:hypothetical protein
LTDSIQYHRLVYILRTNGVKFKAKVDKIWK